MRPAHAWPCPLRTQDAEPTHGERFVALLTQHYPTWREARAELNELPLAAEMWNQR